MAKVNEKISWEDARELIERRLNRLAMCKRGVVETDINSQLEALGKPPAFTKEELRLRKKALASEIKKAMTPTVALINECDGSIYNVLEKMRKAGEAVLKEHSIHPGLKKWQAKKNKIEEQQKARIAQLDADFRDVVDKFLIGSMDLSQFSDEYNKLEGMSW